MTSVRMVVVLLLTWNIYTTIGPRCRIGFTYTPVDADKRINRMMWQNAGRSGIDQWNFVLPARIPKIRLGLILGAGTVFS
jgi:hypothetical protein